MSKNSENTQFQNATASTLRAISGNMIEDERKLTAIDFGFGYQDPSFGGTVGLSPYHMDIMLSAPTVILDGKEMSGDGSFSSGMGFVDV